MSADFAMPPLNFPAELPITAQRREIAHALRHNRVLIVCGDTGSGKTTQLPKIALEAGGGARGLIGITQPRRLAALAMAERVAQEMGVNVGGFVGVQHRFERRLSDQTRVKFMTDGILLSETRHDALLRAYDTIIIDEAHERSLNIDFLLGILRNILPRRRDLRVIISSATLDAARFADFFAGNGTPAPTTAIPGRLYPITIRHTDIAENADDDPDLPRLVADTIDAIADSPGDVLVFLPGERDIRDTAELLNGRRLPDTVVIPLLASLPAGEQQRAFKTLPGIRRIILATNVAETSLTLPGIRTVIDSGLARVPRWNARTRVQRLQVEPISQASANQRAGRCGRVGPGLCIRLYSEADFQARPRYTDPEITRSSLAGVILTMLDLRLGNIATFPFLDPPPPAAIRDGWRELLELGAVAALPDADNTPSLTPLGRRLAALPLDPRFARILLAADHEKALADALIIVAALEGDDPRRRPIEKQAEADTAHARFLTPTSDFAAYLKLWRWYDENGGFSSNTSARRLCRDNFLSFPKMRDWRDLREQLEKLTTRLGLDVTANSGGDIGLHRALLTGLLCNIGKLDPETKMYRGAHGLQFAIFPGSGLAKAPKQKRAATKEPAAHSRPPPQQSREWVIAGELVETSRLYARTAAAIDPSWIEPLARHLCKYSYHSPWWDAVHGHARVRTRVTLFGLLLVENRARDYGRVDPPAARELFIRHALMEPQFPHPPPLIANNHQKIAALHQASGKLRQRQDDLEETLFNFFSERLPPDICDANALRRRLRQEPALAHRLQLDETIVAPPQIAADNFPDTLTLAGATLPLTYRHAPGEEDDGITCTVSVAQLPLLQAWRADWLVPGFLPHKIHCLLSTLPAKTRAMLAPLADTTARLLTHLKPGRTSLAEALSNALYETAAIRIPPQTWEAANLPAWLQVNFVVTNDTGAVIARGRNLETLLRLYAPATTAPQDHSTASGKYQRDNITAWDFGSLPAEINLGTSTVPVFQYPALCVATPDTCSLRLFPDPHSAAAAHHQGVAHLIAITLGPEFNRLARPLAISKNLTPLLRELEYTAESLGRDLALAAIKNLFLDDRPPIHDNATFTEALQKQRHLLGTTLSQLQTLVLAILHSAQAQMQKLKHAATALSSPGPTPAQLAAKPAKPPRTMERGTALATFADLLNAANRGTLPVLPEHPAGNSMHKAAPSEPPLPASATDDIEEQLAWLLFPGFVAIVPFSRLQHYPRYLEAIDTRITRLGGNIAADTRRLETLRPLWQRYTDFVAAQNKPPHDRQALNEYRWLLEEFRVSLFAQELRTIVPVSQKRLDVLWQKVVAQ